MTSVEVVVVPRTLGLLLPEPAHQNARKTEVDDLRTIDYNASIILDITGPSTAGIGVGGTTLPDPRCRGSPNRLNSELFQSTTTSDI